MAATVNRLRTLTTTGDFAYFADIAHFMAGLPRSTGSTTRWAYDEEQVRSRGHALVPGRQEYPR